MAKRTAQLLELNKELEERAEKEARKRVKSEQLLFEQKKFADMGQMLGAIAHQWRQPLNSIGLEIQDLKDAEEFGQLDQEYLTRHVDSCMEQIKYMSHTIDDFRKFFLPEKEKTDFSAAEEIINTFKLLKAMLFSKGIEVNLICSCIKDHVCNCMDEAHSCTTGASRIMGYPGEFKQSVMNLAYNSIDAIEDNKKGEGVINISIDAKGDDVVINFCDNGGGIPDHVIKKVFDPYFTTKLDKNGTGIGLYMTKLVMEHMGANISVSNTDEGACFRIAFKKIKTAEA